MSFEVSNIKNREALMSITVESFKVYRKLNDFIVKEKKFLGKNDGICRYCKKSRQETKFNKKAHSFPELIGNKLLFSYDECDECNEYFDKHLENHLANYLGITRTISKISGKNSIPKYKSNSGERIERFNNDLMIIENHDSNIIDDNSPIKVEVTKHTYIPMNVYRCFVKMALSIMPIALLPKFQKTIEWVRYNTKDHNNSFLQIHYTILRKMAPVSSIRASLIRRKEYSETLPYMFCIIMFGNSIFQFIVPFNDGDKDVNGDALYFPPLDPELFTSPHKVSSFSITSPNLTSTNKRKDEKDAFLLNEKQDFVDIGADELPEEIRQRLGGGLNLLL